MECLKDSCRSHKVITAREGLAERDSSNTDLESILQNLDTSINTQK